MRATPLAFMLAAACGRLNFDEAAMCGDGRTAVDESCDDGNTDDTDGCRTDCTVRPGYVCEGQPSACAPLGEFGQPVVVVLTGSNDDDRAIR